MDEFKERNKALQYMSRELKLIREHNKTFKPGDPQEKLIMFAEGTLVCMVFEHFVRMVAGPLGEGKTLFPLLQAAVKAHLIRLPWEDQEDGIRKVCNVRNSILHGNFAQAAKAAGCCDVEHYFQSQYAPEIEHMCKILEHVMDQIDRSTGKPHQHLEWAAVHYEPAGS